MKKPKSWQNSVGSQCKFFHTYPAKNEHGDDYAWECYHPEEYGKDVSNPSKIWQCPGFKSN
ncbi:hypothetical protein ACE1CI_03445 [Aerosakkonemataceae cyanobacterium BLCC-F50]|uniref:Uncharacterized protein n=1 Tax=Floridaenema flaviceps BLCC-F50 TaxID=3153642 RepID=A0ABV4XJV5_9CYAN